MRSGTKDDTYATMNRLTWEQILRRNGFAWVPPLSTHIPIHPARSSDFVHVDGALSVCRRRVPPGMSCSNIDHRKELGELETLMVQFALDDPPFMPDFRLTEFSLAENLYPLVTASYLAFGISYEMEYACCPLDDQQALLHIRGTLRNNDNVSREVCLRAKVNVQKEAELFEYHYAPFYWDASKWLPCTRVTLQKDQLFLDERIIGKVDTQGFDIAWEPQAHSKAEGYNQKFCCPKPYYVSPPMQLRSIQDVLRFTAKLDPGESKTFSMALLVNVEQVDASHIAALTSMTADQCHRKAIAHFQGLFPDPRTELRCPSGNYGDIFTALQVSSDQLLVDYQDGQGWMPTQGGTSERFYVWIWEAVCMLRPMLQTGHFDAVRHVLDFMFRLQDGGFPPEGDFTTLEGAIGTTGPRWMNSTGSALGLAAEYCLYSADSDFVDTRLDKMLRAGDWILGEVCATRRLNADGSRPPGYGLMPFGCATDADIGHVVAFTDVYTWWGLNQFAHLLQRIDHPRANEVRRETDLYRSDILAAIQLLTRDDGFIDRMIHTHDDRERVAYEFRHVCGAIHYAVTGVVDVNADSFRAYVSYFESHLAEHYFTGAMDPCNVYIGTSECAWHDAYLRMGEWKKAFAAMQTYLKYGLSQDTYQVQERFSKRDPAWTPWQPNGSGNGRMVSMILKSVYFEYDDPAHGETAVLLSGLPYAWLIDNGTTSLTNLRTDRGLLSLEAEVVTQGSIRLTLSCGDRLTLPTTVRIPDFLNVVQLPDGTKNMGDGFYRVGREISCITLILGNGETCGKCDVS